MHGASSSGLSFQNLLQLQGGACASVHSLQTAWDDVRVSGYSTPDCKLGGWVGGVWSGPVSDHGSCATLSSRSWCAAHGRFKVWVTCVGSAFGDYSQGLTSTGEHIDEGFKGRLL